MDLENSFVVPADIGTTWSLLLDLGGLAPCVPGTVLTSVDDGRYAAVIRVKLGPITMAYEGEATIVDADEAGHRAVIEGCGRETRGPGTARAVLALHLVAEAKERTRVDVATRLLLTGKAAQFAPSVLGEASRRLVELFVGNLEHRVLETRGLGEPGRQAGAREAQEQPPGVRSVSA